MWEEPIRTPGKRNLGDLGEWGGDGEQGWRTLEIRDKIGPHSQNVLHSDLIPSRMQAKPGPRCHRRASSVPFWSHHSSELADP